MRLVGAWLWQKNIDDRRYKRKKIVWVCSSNKYVNKSVIRCSSKHVNEEILTTNIGQLK